MRETQRNFKQQMNIAEFDQFLHEHHAIEFYYSTVLQPMYDKWNNSVLSDITFTQWKIVVSPNTLIMSANGNSMTIHRFRHVEVTQTGDNVYQADMMSSDLTAKLFTTRIMIYTEHN